MSDQEKTASREAPPTDREAIRREAFEEAARLVRPWCEEEHAYADADVLEDRIRSLAAPAPHSGSGTSDAIIEPKALCGECGHTGDCHVWGYDCEVMDCGCRAFVHRPAPAPSTGATTEPAPDANARDPLREALTKIAEAVGRRPELRWDHAFGAIEGTVYNPEALAKALNPKALRVALAGPRSEAGRETPVCWMCGGRGTYPIGVCQACNGNGATTRRPTIEDMQAMLGDGATARIVPPPPPPDDAPLRRAARSLAKIEALEADRPARIDAARRELREQAFAFVRSAHEWAASPSSPATTPPGSDR